MTAVRAERQVPLAAGAALLALVSLQTGAAFAKSLFPLVGSDGVAALRLGLAALGLGLVLRPWRLRLEARGWKARRLRIPRAMIGWLSRYAAHICPASR